VSTEEVGLDVVAGVAACNQSIEVVTEEVLDGVSAPAHVVITEPSSVVIVEVPFVLLILISDLKRVLHDLFSYFVLFQIPFYSLNPILYPFLIVGCEER
jgi:hypothetical protein